MMILLPPDHELTACERVPLEALNDEDYILLNEGNDYDISRILSGINVNIVHAVVKSLAVPRFRTIGLAVTSLKDASPLTRLFIDIVQNYLDNIDSGADDIEYGKTTVSAQRGCSAVQQMLKNRRKSFKHFRHLGFTNTRGCLFSDAAH